MTLVLPVATRRTDHWVSHAVACPDLRGSKANVWLFPGTTRPWTKLDDRAIGCGQYVMWHRVQTLAPIGYARGVCDVRFVSYSHAADC